MSAIDRYRRFVDEYLIDLNATEAAIRAGYSPKTAKQIGSRLLTNVDVKSILAARRSALAVNTTITPERVLEELGRIGFSDMRRFTQWGSEGVTLLESAGLDDNDARCVAEVSETQTKDGGSLRFKLHDKVTALTQIGRHFGMFTDKAEVSVTALTPEERKARIAQLLAK